MRKYCLIKPRTTILGIGSRPFDTEKDMVLSNIEMTICMAKGRLLEILKDGSLKELDYNNYALVTEDTVTDFDNLPKIKYDTIDSIKIIDDEVLSNTTKQEEITPTMFVSDNLGIQQEILYVKPEENTESDETETAESEEETEDDEESDETETAESEDVTITNNGEAKEETEEPVKEVKKETQRTNNTNRKNR